MATIDSSIALGVKPVQIQDPVNQFAKQQELSVNALKMREMDQAVQDRNLLRQLDPSSKDYISQVGRINPKLALELQEGQQKTKKTGLEIDEKQLGLHRERVADLAFNPSDNNVLAHLEDGVLRGNITPEQAKQQWAQVGAMSPTQRKEYFTLMGVNAEKRLSDLTSRRGQDITVRGQDLTFRAATQPVFSEASGGFYTRPTGGKPAEFIPAGGTDMTTKGKSVTKAKENVTTLASEMAKGYADLLEKKGIKSIEAGAASNLSASSQSSMAGQMLGSVFGTEEQDIRDFIKSQRPLLVQSIVKATGMSAQQINSNAELKNILDAATDPSKGYESNIRALNGLNTMFGTGAPILPGAPAEAPPPANNINVPGVGPQLKVPGSGAAPAARPSLDSIFGTPKK